DPSAIATVIQRLISKLWRRHHEIPLRYKPLGQDSIQFLPETILVPVLENPFTLSVLGLCCCKHVSEIGDHHRSHRVGIVCSNRLSQTAEKGLEILVATLVPNGRLSFGRGLVLILMFVEHLATGQGDHAR